VEIRFANEVVSVFTISPRTLERTKYWRDIESIAALSQSAGCTGVLLFTGNDTFVEPWIAAQAVIEATTSLSPLVAVNPAYMHPFSVAKMVSSLAYVHQRRVHLNLVTGTALSHLRALGDDESLSKDDRYDRMIEYVKIIDALLSPTRTANFTGRFYRVENLQLPPGIDPELMPSYYAAGESEGARRLRDATGAIGMEMLRPELGNGVYGKGIHFGIVTRSEQTEAWRVARELFPEDRLGQRIQERSMGNTDAEWKRRMFVAAQAPDPLVTGYWLEPFKNFKADCPYYVGDRQSVASLIESLVRAGIRTFILDIPNSATEFDEVRAAFASAESRLQQHPPQATS
jgi:alkanesulfonate monooxygenase